MMKRILFVPFAPSLAHVSRCLALASELKKRGNECLFAVGKERTELVRKAGFETRSVPEVPSGLFWIDSTWKWFSKKYFISNINAEVKIIEEFQPELIVFDFRFTTAVSARIKNIRSLAIVHGTALHILQNPELSALDILSFDENSLARIKKMPVFRFIFPLVYTWFLKRPVRKIKRILEKNSMFHVKTIFDLTLGNLNLVADIPPLIPGKVQLIDTRIVGPLMWEGWNKPWNSDRIFLDSRPLIYLTMGSTTNAQQTVYKIIEAIHDLPYNLVVSKGSMEWDQDKIPENVHICSYVPGNTIAKKCILVIFHGGHETLMQVIMAGVPSLVIPVNPDQVLIARQIKKCGIGNFLRNPKDFPITRQPLRNIPVQALREAVKETIENRLYKINCMKLREMMTKYIHEKKYLDLIDEL